MSTNSQKPKPPTPWARQAARVKKAAEELSADKTQRSREFQSAKGALGHAIQALAEGQSVSFDGKTWTVVRGRWSSNNISTPSSRACVAIVCGNDVYEPNVTYHSEGGMIPEYADKERVYKFNGMPESEYRHVDFKEYMELFVKLPEILEAFNKKYFTPFFDASKTSDNPQHNRRENPLHGNARRAAPKDE